MEVLNVTDDDAKAHLIKCGMPETLAIWVVELTGGRLIHLMQAVKLILLTPLSVKIFNEGNQEVIVCKEH